MAVRLLLFLALTAFDETAMADRDKALQRCVSLDKKIERYTRLRRAGGSAAQMERWRDARRKAQDEFQELRCHKYGRRLRSGK